MPVSWGDDRFRDERQGQDIQGSSRKYGNRGDARAPVDQGFSDSRGCSSWFGATSPVANGFAAVMARSDAQAQAARSTGLE